CCSITSETRIAYGSRVRRHGRSRAVRANQARSSSSTPPSLRPRAAPARYRRRVATTTVIRSDRFPDLDDEVLYPRLSDAKLEWLAERGERRSFQPGDVLYEHAVRDAPFYVLE